LEGFSLEFLEEFFTPVLGRNFTLVLGNIFTWVLRMNLTGVLERILTWVLGRMLTHVIRRMLTWALGGGSLVFLISLKFLEGFHFVSWKEVSFGFSEGCSLGFSEGFSIHTALVAGLVQPGAAYCW
jgi:hypothetical protein